jgi:tape measure domain-containing protein
MVKARDEILTEYTGNTRGFARAARFYDQTLAKQENLTNTRLTRIDSRWERSSRTILRTTTALGGIGAALGLAQLRSYAEGWRNVERRLQSVGAISTESQTALVDLALRTRSAVGSTADAVQRMAKSTDGDFDTTLRRVETLQKLLATGGASGTERASVSLQLGQALKSGRLSGDEFRSISENAPVEFLDALSRAAGVARKDLKDFAQDQKLTTDIVLVALDSLATSADVNFRAMAVSGEEAVNVLTTGLTAYVGKLDDSLGATSALNGAMVAVGEYMSGAGEGAENMAAAVQILGAVALSTAGSRGVGALTASLKKAAAARNADVVAAQKQHAVSRQAVIDVNGEIASIRVRRRTAEADYQRRIFQGKSAITAAKARKNAIEAEARALVRLQAVEARATVATNALTSAQKRLSLAARLSAAGLRSLSAVMAFFGGPVGLALAAVTTTLAVMATRTSEVERLTESVTGRVQLLTEAYGEVGGKVDDLRQKMAATSLAQAIADAKELERALNIARQSAKTMFSRAFPGRLSEFPELRRLVRDLMWGKVSAENFKIELNSMVGSGSAAFQEVALELEKFLAPLMKAEEGAQRASDVLMVLNGTSEQAAAALVRLGIVMDNAAGDAANLASNAGAAAQGIAGLIAMVPALNDAARMQGKLVDAAANRDKALADLGEQSGWGPGEFQQASEINQLYTRATSEIDGTAEATRRANRELDSYTDSARISALDARGQALAREAQQYDRVVAQLEKAAAGEAALAAAKAAHDQRNSQINDQFNTKGGGGSGAVASAGQLYQLQEILIEGGQRHLYVEAALNAERERLAGLLPNLTSLGLSRADAESLIADQLQRVEEGLQDVSAASEEASKTFARGMLNEIKHAEDLSDAIGGIGDRLLDLAYDQAFDLLAEQFGRLGGSGGSGGSSGGFGWVTDILGGIFGGARAKGGGAQAGKAYLVNEDTPNSEIFVPSQSGAVLNVAQAQAALRDTSSRAAGGGRSSLSVKIFNAPEGNHQVRQTDAGDLEITLDRKIDGAIQKQVFGPRGQKRMQQTFGLRPSAKGV